MMLTKMLHLNVTGCVVICKTMSVVGSGGLQGCMFCDIQGVKNKDLNKTIYLQNRRFLPMESTLRNDTERQVSQHALTYVKLYTYYIIYMTMFIYSLYIYIYIQFH